MTPRNIRLHTSTGSNRSSTHSNDMNGHLRPTQCKDGPALRPGCSLKRNNLVHKRPERLNGLSVSADRITFKDGTMSSCDTSMEYPSVSKSFDHTTMSNGKVKTSRAPSPKRKPAPSPPPTSPPPLPLTSPPSPKQVSLEEVANPDHSGWLLDLLRGKRVWCLLADMLFCVFESDSAKQSREIIFLPGCRVRSLVFNSAKSENVDKDASNTGKTITGVDKYQFYIENVSIRKYLFGVKNKTELDDWVDILTRACDVALFDNAANHSRDSDGSESCDDSVFTPTSSYLPSPTRTRRMSMISMSLRDKDLCSAKSEAMVDFRKRLRKDTDEPKVAPVKGLHIIDSTKEPKKSKSFLKLKSFGSLDSLLKRKRSKSAERSSSVDSHSLDETKSLEYSGSDTESAGLSRPASSGQSFLSRSWDSGKSSNGLGSSIRRRASDLKDKVFGAGKTPQSCRSPGLRLKDLSDIRISGHLQYKFMMRWIKVWCVVSRGCFYGFKTHRGDESPMLAVVLTQSTVSYVTEPEKRNKKLYVFKLSQPHSKSIYLCAQEEGDLSMWLQTLQMEACRIQADESLAKESTSDCNFSVDSALSAMSMASSHTDLTENFHAFSNQPVLNSTSHSMDYASGMYDFHGSDVTGRLDSTESADDWDDSSQSSANDGPHPRYGDQTPKHDPSVSYLWGKDKGYLLQMIRAKLRKGRRSQGETDGDFYDREIPRSNGGCLLVIGDDADRERKGPLEIKAGRSKSFGDFHSTRMDTVGPDGSLDSRGGRARPRTLAVRKLPAQELESPTLASYLERKSFNGQWIRYWYVIKGGYLYCYLTPEDQVTVDITNLHGYTVTSLVDQFRGKRFVLHLSHENYIPVDLSVESRDEMEAWSEAIQNAAQLPETENDENPEVNALASPEKGDNSDKRLSVKQRLLAEVLRQKEELEKKQAARRLAAQKSETSGKETGEAHISTVTRLKQRRLSTQIKMEAIQRQIGDGSKNGQKKSLFKIGKKKSHEDKNPQLVEQLKELSTTLKEIDINLNQEGVHTNNNVTSSKVGFHKVPTDGDLLKKGDSFESEEQAVHRSNSLKASVQRLAHRTFAKAGWRKNSRKSHSLHIDEYHPDDPEFSLANQSQEMIDLTTHSADIISSISFSSSAELTSLASSSDCSMLGSQDPESPLSGRSTPASLCSPRSPRSPASPRITAFPHSPKLSKASPRDRGLVAARAEMMTRSYSAGPTMSNSSNTSSFDGEPSSPRREVSPSIMAEIDAFEEFTKQALAQSSALTSH